MAQEERLIKGEEIAPSTAGYLPDTRDLEKTPRLANVDGVLFVTRLCTGTRSIVP